MQGTHDTAYQGVPGDHIYDAYGHHAGVLTDNFIWDTHRRYGSGARWPPLRLERWADKRRAVCRRKFATTTPTTAASSWSFSLLLLLLLPQATKALFHRLLLYECASSTSFSPSSWTSSDLFSTRNGLLRRKLAPEEAPRAPATTSEAVAGCRYIYALKHQFRSPPRANLAIERLFRLFAVSAYFSMRTRDGFSQNPSSQPVPMMICFENLRLRPFPRTVAIHIPGTAVV